MKRITLLYAAICMFASLPAQIPGELTIADLERWNRITESLISNDGKATAFVLEPWDGDPQVKIYNSNAEEVAAFSFATGISFTSDSEFLIMTFKQPDSLIRSLKFRKTKKEDMPSDMLGVYNI